MRSLGDGSAAPRHPGSLPRPLDPLPQRRPGPPLRLSTAQAARTLGVSLSTVRRWSDSGHLHSYRTPTGQRRFSSDELMRFVTSLTQGEDTYPGS